jgi:hypothetical protein
VEHGEGIFKSFDVLGEGRDTFCVAVAGQQRRGIRCRRILHSQLISCRGSVSTRGNDLRALSQHSRNTLNKVETQKIFGVGVVEEAGVTSVALGLASLDETGSAAVQWLGG